MTLLNSHVQLIFAHSLYLTMDEDKSDDTCNLVAPQSRPKKNKLSKLSTKNTSVDAASNASLDETLNEFQDRGKSYRRTTATVAAKSKPAAAHSTRSVRSSRNHKVQENQDPAKAENQKDDDRKATPVSSTGDGPGASRKSRPVQKCVSCDQMIAKPDFMRHFKTCLNTNFKHSTDSKPTGEEGSQNAKNVPDQGEQHAAPVHCSRYVLCQVCQDDLSDWSVEDRNRHVNQCIDHSIEETSSHDVLSCSATAEGSVGEKECFVCQSDLSSLSIGQKEWHINDCLDKKMKPKVKSANVKAENTVSSVTSEGVLGCPICGKSLKTQAARLNHIKRCGIKYNVPTTVILQSVREQHQAAASASSSAASTASNVPSTSAATTASRGRRGRLPGTRRGDRKRLEEPSSRLDEATQLALALSSSLHQDKSESDKNLPVPGEPASDPSDAPQPPDAFSVLMSPTKPKPVSRNAKAKQKANTVPDLLRLLPDEKLERLEQRLASVLLFHADRILPTPPLKQSQFTHEDELAPATPDKNSTKEGHIKHRLWWRSSLVNLDVIKDRHSFYVPQLSTTVVISKPPSVAPLPEPTPPQAPEFLVPGDITVRETAKSSKPSNRNETLVASTQTALLLAALATENDQSVVMDTTFSSGSPALEMSASGSHSSQQLESKSQEALAIQPEQPSGFLIVPQEEDNTEEKPSNSSAMRLTSDLGAMVANPLASDLQLRCKGGESIPLHSFILAARSPCLYRRIQAADFVDVSEFDRSTVMVLLRYLYTGNFDMGDVDAGQVSSLAHRWYLDELMSRLDIGNDGCSAAASDDRQDAAAAAEDAFTEIAADPLLLWSSDEGDSETDTDSSSSDDNEKPSSPSVKLSQRSQKMASIGEEHLCDTEILDQLLNSDVEDGVTMEHDEMVGVTDEDSNMLPRGDAGVTSVEDDVAMRETLLKHSVGGEFSMAGLTQSPVKRSKHISNKDVRVTLSCSDDKERWQALASNRSITHGLGNCENARDGRECTVALEVMPVDSIHHQNSLNLPQSQGVEKNCTNDSPGSSEVESQDKASTSSSGPDLFECIALSDEDKDADNEAEDSTKEDNKAAATDDDGSKISKCTDDPGDFTDSKSVSAPTVFLSSEKHSSSVLNSPVEMMHQPSDAHQQAGLEQETPSRNKSMYSSCSEEVTPELFADTCKKPSRCKKNLEETPLGVEVCHKSSSKGSSAAFTAQDSMLSDCDIEGLSSPHVLDVRLGSHQEKLCFDHDSKEQGEQENAAVHSEGDASQADVTGDGSVVVEISGDESEESGRASMSVTRQSDHTHTYSNCGSVGHVQDGSHAYREMDFHHSSKPASDTILPQDAEDELLSPNDQIWKYNSPRRPVTSRLNVQSSCFDSSEDAENSPVFCSQRMPMKRPAMQGVRRILNMMPEDGGSPTDSCPGEHKTDDDGIILLDEDDTNEGKGATLAADAGDPYLTLLSPQPNIHDAQPSCNKRKRRDASPTDQQIAENRKRFKIHEDEQDDGIDPCRNESGSSVLSTLQQDMSSESSSVNNTPPKSHTYTDYEMSPIFCSKKTKQAHSPLQSNTSSRSDDGRKSQVAVKTVSDAQGRNKSEDVRARVVDSSPADTCMKEEMSGTEPDSIDLTQDEPDDDVQSGDPDVALQLPSQQSSHSSNTALSQDVWDGFDDAGALPDDLDVANIACSGSSFQPDPVRAGVHQSGHSPRSRTVGVNNQSLSGSMLAYDPPTDMETDVSTLMNNSTLWAADNEPVEKKNLLPSGLSGNFQPVVSMIETFMDHPMFDNESSQKVPVKKKKKKKSWIPPTPLTPMPDFSKLATPQVMKRLQEYGIRKVSKKKGVKILQDAFCKLHQYETDTDCSFSAEGASKSPSAPIASSQISTAQQLKQKKPAKKPPKAAATKAVSRSRKQAVEQQSDDEERGNLPSSSVPDLNSSEASIESEMQECPEESMLVCEQLPSTPPSSSQLTASPRNKEQKLIDKKQKILKYIKSSEELYLKVLHYEPMELDFVQSKLKEGGIVVGLQTLMDFLDEMSIQFTMRETRKDEKGAKPAKRKGRKTKKVASSQQK